MHRFISLVKSVIYKFLIAFVVLVSLAVFLLTTTPGLYLTVTIIGHVVPGQLKITGLSGRAVHRLAFEQLVYRNDDLQLTIQQADLNWRLRTLFHKKLTIKDLETERLDLVFLQKKDVAAAPKPKQPSTLPIPVNIQKLTIKTLNINSAEHQQTLTNLVIGAEFNKQLWRIHQLDFSYKNHRIHLYSDIDPVLPYPIKASLNIKPLAANQGLRGKVKLSGNFFHYHWTAKLRAPTALSLEGDLINGKTINSEAKWQDFRLPLNKTTLVHSSGGQLSVKGGLNNLSIQLDTNLIAPLAAKIEVSTTKKDEDIKAQARIFAREGDLNLDLAYNPLQTPKLNGLITAKAFANDPASALRDLTLNGSFKGDNLAQLLIQAQLNALYFNHKLQGELQAAQQKLLGTMQLGGNQLQLAGNYPFSSGTLSASLTELGLLHPVLEKLKTSLSIKAVLNNPQQGSMVIKINPGKFETEDKLPLLFKGGELLARLDSKQLKVDSKLTIDDTKTLNLTLSLPNFRFAASEFNQQKLKGEMQLSIRSLAFLQSLDTALGKIEGQLETQLKLSGTLEKPSVTSKLQLSKASMDLPQLGLRLQPIAFNLQSKNHQWQASGSVMSNGIPLSIKGEGEFSPVLNGALQIKSDNFPLINTSEYLINVSPALTLEFAPKLLKMSGNLLIPKAQIKPQSFTDTVSLPDDVVFVNQNQTARVNPYPIDTDIDLVMGNEVTLAVKGLQGLLTGKIHLHQRPEQPLSATGELNIVNGKYKAYGQDLSIDQGQLVFTGSNADNPELHLRAVRQFDSATNSFSGSNQLFDFKGDNLQTLDLGSKTTVGIQVEGRLNTPKIQLFSIPANLSQADILSLLLLGKPASQASQAGGQLLMTAFSALNLNSGANGTQLLEQLKQSLGVDFNLANNTVYDEKTKQDSNKTAFVVGKALSKRLYLSYNMGLSQADSNVLTLKYLLNKFFSIQVNAGMAGNGIDFLYTHQKE